MKVAVALLAVTTAAPACSGKKPQDDQGAAKATAEQHANDLIAEAGHELTSAVASLDQARTRVQDAFAKLEGAVPADKAAVKAPFDAAWADVVRHCDAVDKAVAGLGPNAPIEQVKAAARPIVDAIHELDGTRVALYQALNQVQDAVQDAPANVGVTAPYGDFTTAWDNLAGSSGELGVLIGMIPTTDLDARVEKLRADDKLLSQQEDALAPDAAANPKLQAVMANRQQIHVQLAELGGASLIATRLKGMTVAKECLENPLAKGCP